MFKNEYRRYLRNRLKNDLSIRIDNAVSNDVFWSIYIRMWANPGFAIINAIEAETKRNSNAC